MFVPVVVALVAIDWLAKSWAQATLRPGVHEFDLGIVDLTLVHNAGAAFGLGQGNGVAFIVLAIVVCVAAVAWLIFAKRRSAFEVLGLALIVAGGIGNCIDRLMYGHVTDFICFTFIDFPVFNVADICVTCGVIVFIIALVAHEFAPLDSDAKEQHR